MTDTNNIENKKYTAKMEAVYDAAMNAFESQRIVALSCEDPKAQADMMAAAQKLLDTALNTLKLEGQLSIEYEKLNRPAQFNKYNNGIPNQSGPSVPATNRKQALAQARIIEHDDIPSE